MKWSSYFIHDSAKIYTYMLYFIPWMFTGCYWACLQALASAEYSSIHVERWGLIRTRWGTSLQLILLMRTWIGWAWWVRGCVHYVSYCTRALLPTIFWPEITQEIPSKCVALKFARIDLPMCFIGNFLAQKKKKIWVFGSTAWCTSTGVYVIQLWK